MANSVQTFSDFNRSGQKASVVSSSRLYSDLDLSLTLHPIFRDIMPLTDTDAVINAVKNLLFTNFHERPFRPNLGSNLSNLLFEPADVITIIRLKQAILTVLQKNEPRIDSIVAEIVDDSDNNRYHVELSFRVISPNREVDIELFLSRLR
jgi:phage baseplate assembly protein W